MWLQVALGIFVFYVVVNMLWALFVGTLWGYAYLRQKARQAMQPRVTQRDIDKLRISFGYEPTAQINSVPLRKPQACPAPSMELVLPQRAQLETQTGTARAPLEGRTVTLAE